MPEDNGADTDKEAKAKAREIAIAAEEAKAPPERAARERDRDRVVAKPPPPKPLKPLPTLEPVIPQPYVPPVGGKPVAWAWKEGATLPDGRPDPAAIDKTKPTVLETPDGELHFTPHHKTMWGELGWRTQSEYLESQRTGKPSQYVGITEGVDKPMLVSRRELAKASGLKGEEQFKALKKVGVIPTGAKFLPGPGGYKGTDWSYIHPDTLKKMKGQLLAKQAASIIEPGIEFYEQYIKDWEKSHIKLPDGNWIDITDWNKLPERYQVVGMRKGYSAMVSAIDADLAMRRGALRAMDKFKRYIRPEGDKRRQKLVSWDILAAINAGVSDRHLNILFDDITIKAAKQVAPYSTAQDVDAGQFLIDNPGKEDVLRELGVPQQDINSIKQNLKNLAAAQAGALPISKAVWRILTPWAEEEGETFTTAVKGLPKQWWRNVTNPKVDNQVALKMEYEKMQSSPLWMQLLFGTSVIKDPKTEKYYRVLAGEPPLIVPAGGATKLTRLIVDTATKKLPAILKTTTPGATKLITAADLGMTEAQFAKFVAWRVSQLGKTAAWAGKDAALIEQQVLIQAKALHSMRAYIQRVFGITEKQLLNLSAKELLALEQKLVAQTLKDVAAKKVLETMRQAHIAGLRAAATRGDKKAIATLKALGLIRKATTTEARQFAIPGKLTFPRMQELLADLAKMKPTTALINLTTAGAVLPLLAVNPTEAYKIFIGASTKARTDALAKVDTKIGEAINTGNLAKAQTLALTQLQARTAALARVKGVVKPAVASQAAIASLVKTQPKALIKPSIKPLLKPAIKPAVLPAIKIAPKPVIAPAPVSLPAPPKVPPKVPAKPPPPVKLPPPIKTDKEKRKAIMAAEGAICWRQGELHGKDVWQVSIFPYNKKENWFTVLGRKPEGATLFKGPRSAYQSLRLLRGKPPAKKVSVDIGFMDASLKPVGERKIGLGFKPDPKMQTTGDITLGRRTPPITERPAGLGRGKPPRITPKTPRLRR